MYVRTVVHNYYTTTLSNYSIDLILVNLRLTMYTDSSVTNYILNMHYETLILNVSIRHVS